MAGYMTLVLGMILLPCLYGGSMVLYRDSFQEERNRSRIPLRTGRELAVMLLGELALLLAGGAGFFAGFRRAERGLL